MDDYDVPWSTVRLRIPHLKTVLLNLLEDAPKLPPRDSG